MKATSDVIVVGGGPTGSFTALNIAKHGANVMVFEEHEKIGFPSHCAGHLSLKGLKNLGLYPLPTKIVENIFYGAKFHSPKGKSFSIRFSQPVTCVVNRTLFDNYIARIAEENGVHYCLNSQVESLIIENFFVKGVKVKQNGKVEREFLSKIVVDAEGISSRILKQAALASSNPHMFVNGVEAEVENIKDIEHDMVEVFLGKKYAPGFYAWLIPKRNGKAKIGLATKTGNPKELLQRLMVKHPIASKKLRATRILRLAYHPLTLGGPIPKTFSNGFLAVGDVASQVKPTTGGGVIFGMTCSRIAAEVISEALQRNEFSEEKLSLYQKRFMEILGFDMNVMLRIRKMLNAIPDNKLESIISFCVKIDLDKVLRKFEDLDFQGKALIRTLRYPSMWATMIYLTMFCSSEISIGRY